MATQNSIFIKRHFVDLKMDYKNASIPDLQRMAGADDADAQFELGVRYAHGKGVAQDYATSVKWFRAAANLGHAGAEDSLGVRYATGQGVMQNDAEAVKWFRRSAERGYAVAQFNLALAYVQGQGIAPDLVQAYAWFALSAAQHDAMAEQSRDRTAENLGFDPLRQAKILFHKLHRQIHGKRNDI